MKKEEYRDINWTVNFDITVNGENMFFDNLNETEQEKILADIKEGFYGGTFCD
jgi:hypothetical protein